MKLDKLIFCVLVVYSSAITFFVLYGEYITHKATFIRTSSREQAQLLAFKDSRVNIIINAAPKSGSAYIAKALETGLGYDHSPISAEYIPRDQINYSLIKDFYAHGSKLSKQHMDPSRLNLQILKRFTDKMVLVMRDPREILLSWVYHLNSEREAKVDLYYFDPEPSESYFTLSLSEQIDWNIQHFLPELILWMDNWTKVKQEEDAKANGLKILVVTYNELTSNELNLFDKILAFYAIPKSQFDFHPPPKTNKVHFRKGDSNEWRQVYTEAQLQRINSLISDELLTTYGWQR